MKVLFVCTGNICRSPMGELLFPHFFSDPNLIVDSAGTNGLDAHPIDPSSAQLLTTDGIDSSSFRSKRLTPQLARSADLIFCFSAHQRSEIIQRNPTVARRTVVLTDFANMCNYCATHNLITGDSLEERFDSVLANASLIRPMLPHAQDIADPYQREFEAFKTAHAQINEALATIAHAIDQ
ncbi:protein-tyrosine-phosphatase [Bifidobacterium dolichotidis]|uniref:Protein-tyrosine-phosphatase n=1 Tax=Bifidobacterium dolichotidis TaxID=2306976 RepID=A0A430FRQ3_9BIFI|nr:low molecular weight phosphatase family protein [Bifidobacterium dolichotidis]RSX55523.1 protein-tyrosine-phosphatase [Bifidobacterium dolichotidis]